MVMSSDSDPTVSDDTSPSEQTADAAPPIEHGPTAAEPVPAAAEPSSSQGAAAAEEPEPERESIIDAIADLLQMFVNWLRAEAADLVRDKVVLPIQQLGLTLASASAAGCLLVIGLVFISIAVLLLLAEWLGWPGALTLVGTVFVIGAAVFTAIKMRSIQK